MDLNINTCIFTACHHTDLEYLSSFAVQDTSLLLPITGSCGQYPDLMSQSTSYPVSQDMYHFDNQVEGFCEQNTLFSHEPIFGWKEPFAENSNTIAHSQPHYSDEDANDNLNVMDRVDAPDLQLNRHQDDFSQHTLQDLRARPVEQTGGLHQLQDYSATQPQGNSSHSSTAINVTSTEAENMLGPPSASHLGLGSTQILQCSQCEHRPFRRPCDLKKHIKNRHSLVFCLDNICKKTFKSEAAARRHFSTTHAGEPTLYCSFDGCKKARNGSGGGFRRRDVLDRHTKKLHTLGHTRASNDSAD